jgi:hypothetical protein
MFEGITSMARRLKGQEDKIKYDIEQTDDQHMEIKFNMELPKSAIGMYYSYVLSMYPPDQRAKYPQSIEALTDGFDFPVKNGLLKNSIENSLKKAMKQVLGEIKKDGYDVYSPNLEKMVCKKDGDKWLLTVIYMVFIR